jgi:hypothetical protein
MPALQCLRCGVKESEDASVRVREPTDPSVTFERNGERYTNLVVPDPMCDPCASAMARPGAGILALRR